MEETRQFAPLNRNSGEAFSSIDQASDDNMSIEELQAKNDNQDEIIADEHDEEEKVESNI